jgi:hypothetical protein
MQTWRGRLVGRAAACLASGAVCVFSVACAAKESTQNDVTAADLLVRDVTLPSACADSLSPQSLSSDLGPLLGADNIRVVARDVRVAAAPPAQYESEQWGGAKLLIVVHESVKGPIVVRGVSSDGGELRFGMGSTPVPYRLLDPEDRSPLDGGWRDFPNEIRVSASGCYAMQFDYPAGSATVELQIDLREST